MAVSNDSSWMDPASSWWAKVNRASEHITSLRKLVDEFRDSEPYSLTPEPTDVPDRLRYVLRYHGEVPVTISTTLGDILHNLRGALESLAYELAKRSNGGTLSSSDERRTTFPICIAPDDFDRTMSGRLANLLDSQARDALRAAQPFVNLEEAQRLGVAMDKTHESESCWNPLHRLNTLWNIDKHRRLTVARWIPSSFAYWTSDGKTNRRMLRGDGTLADGSTLFYVDGRDESGSDVVQEFRLIIEDDPTFPESGDATPDIIDLVGQFHWHVVQIVFARVFTIMSR